MNIIGVDEVGRGPIAGPVVACSVRLSKTLNIDTDSKGLSEKKRNYFFQMIKETALFHHEGVVSETIIDNINILQASLKAMLISISTLPTLDTLLIIDGVSKLNSPINQVSIPKADLIHECVAAASIMAKVTRDRIMQDFAKIYPYYGFDSNMGYPTKKHLFALAKYGPCPIHRKTFKPVADVIRSS